MIELKTSQLNAVFHALGDSTRREMLRDLSEGQKTVGQLAGPFAISGPLASAQQWLTHYEHFWTGRLDALESILRAEDEAASITKDGEKK